jgi:hypothetical protein
MLDKVYLSVSGNSNVFHLLIRTNPFECCPVNNAIDYCLLIVYDPIMLVLEASSSIAGSAAPPPDGYTDLKRPGMVVLSSGESHLFAANVSQQEQLRGVEKVELSPVNRVEPERRISLMRPAIHISSRMNTCVIFTSISPRMNTYAIALLESLLE